MNTQDTEHSNSNDHLHRTWSYVSSFPPKSLENIAHSSNFLKLIGMTPFNEEAF